VGNAILPAGNSFLPAGDAVLPVGNAVLAAGNAIPPAGNTVLPAGVAERAAAGLASAWATGVPPARVVQGLLEVGRRAVVPADEPPAIVVDQVLVAPLDTTRPSPPAMRPTKDKSSPL
jgi:hypothetical protein